MRPAALLAVAALALAAATLAGACGGCREERAPPGTRLVVGAYTAPREVLRDLLPRFVERWRAERGLDLAVDISFLGSGAQSRAIIEGFEADVALLALDPDIDRLVGAGLVRGGWRAGPTGGAVTRSVVAFAVRPGNPRGVRGWHDLARPGVDVVTPNPRTSGGAMWNVLALWGAALRGQVEGVAAGDDAAARRLLEGVLANVRVMDKSARDSLTSFEKGVGDVAISYESEILVGRAAGRRYDLVIPRSTIRIDCPIAVVDDWADEHGAREVAESFVAFLLGPEAQAAFAAAGYRPALEGVAAPGPFAEVDDLFTVDDLGGWERMLATVFGSSGIYARALAAAHAR